MLSLFVSTIVYFAAAYFIKRHLDEMGIPKGMTRSVSVFVLALVAAYAAAWGIDLIA